MPKPIPLNASPHTDLFVVECVLPLLQPKRGEGRVEPQRPGHLPHPVQGDPVRAEVQRVQYPVLDQHGAEGRDALRVQLRVRGIRVRRSGAGGDEWRSIGRWLKMHY